MFEKLPKDLKLEIFKRFTVKEKVKFSEVSKEWRELLNSERIWKPAFESFFFRKESMPKVSTSATYGYREAYIKCASITDKIISVIHRNLMKPIKSDKGYSKYKNYVVAAEDMAARLLDNRYLYKRHHLGWVHHSELLHQFLKKYDVNETYTYFGFTLLHLAVVAGSVPAVRYLLDCPHINLSIKTKILENTAEELLDLMIDRKPEYRAFFDLRDRSRNLAVIKELFVKKQTSEQNLSSNKKQKL